VKNIAFAKGTRVKNITLYQKGIAMKNPALKSGKNR
jgi:hypothetical protein